MSPSEYLQNTDSQKTKVKKIVTMIQNNVSGRKKLSGLVKMFNYRN